MKEIWIMRFIGIALAMWGFLEVFTFFSDLSINIISSYIENLLNGFSGDSSGMEDMLNLRESTPEENSWNDWIN